MLLLHPKRSLIFLTGFMGSGKSTVGCRLAMSLGLRFFDLDTEIENRMQKPISQIFEEEGAAFFREIESEILKDLVKLPFSVIALGGGTITEMENLRLVKQHGVLICLQSEPEVIWSRVADTHRRVLLTQENIPGRQPLTESQIHDRIERLIQLRKPYYDESDLFIDTTGKSISQIVDEIISQLELQRFEKL